MKKVTPYHKGMALFFVDKYTHWVYYDIRRWHEMNIEMARTKMNMSRREVSQWLEIPYRTLENWEKGRRPCPVYIEKLIVEKILKGK